MHAALSTLTRFFGFDRPAPLPLPPKARRTDAAPKPRRAKTVSDSAAAALDTLSDELAQAREDQRYLRPPTPKRPLTGAQAVVALAKVQGVSTAERAWYSGRTDAELNAAAKDALGPELHSFCRALYLVGSKPPPVDRPMEHDDAYSRRVLVNLNLDCVSDIDTRERAMHIVTAEQTRQHRAGRPLTPSLVIPEAVLKAIAVRQAERAARLERSRGGRGGTGGGPPSGTTTAGQGGEGSSGGGSTLKGGKKREDYEDDEGNAPPPPAGPKR